MIEIVPLSPENELPIALSADMLNGTSAITESDFTTLENVDGSLIFNETG
jgi:hypothetical protein